MRVDRQEFVCRVSAGTRSYIPGQTSFLLDSTKDEPDRQEFVCEFSTRCSCSLSDTKNKSLKLYLTIRFDSS